MAQPSSPSLSRSRNQLLEYPPSPATSETAKTRSNFDCLIRKHACDISTVPSPLVNENDNQHQHRPLERDLRRLDIDTNQHILSQNNKLLDRTQSISLPTTPIEQMSSAFHQKRHGAVLEQVNDDDNDDEEDDQSISLTSRTDYMVDLDNQDIQELRPDEVMSNSKSTLQSTTSSSSSSSESNIPHIHGVDWSDSAHPTSHCWFPYTLNDPSSAQACSFSSCKNPKPTLLLALVQCESCFIVVHTHHLANAQAMSVSHHQCLPACRPSFADSTDDSQLAPPVDQHFWTPVALLNKPCILCKRKSMSSSMFSSSRPSTMPILDLMNQGGNYRSPIPGSPKTSGASSGLHCLWCSRGYHRRCWDQIYHQDERNKCDYGVFRNIIVRPQWIRRISGPPANYRAQYLSNRECDSLYTPLLLFINKRSGGQSGEKIYRKLLRVLNPRQVFLLENDQTIIRALEIYASLPNVRVCVFGGDGTVGWVLGRLAELYPLMNNPPVCICPLGTGNDLSRVLSWGEQYDPKRLLSTLIQIPQAQAIALDRWQVTIEPVDLTKLDLNSNGGRTFLSMLAHPKFVRDTQRPSYQNHRTLPNTRFINYMSFGLDAAIALEFHDRRSRDPSKFSSPLKNKLMYLNESRKYLNDFARSRMWNLSSYIRLICDGENLTHLIQNCHTLLVLNIPGYASGTNPWGKTSNNSSSHASNIQKDFDSFEQISTSSVEQADIPANTHEVYELVTLNECSNEQLSSSARTTVTTSTGRFERQDFGDKKIEVVGLSTTHMATIHMGFRGIRIAQCSQLRIELCCPMTAQMDGEPFYLPESVGVNISHAGQVLVLRNESR